MTKNTNPALPDIKFVRSLRDCPHNTNIKTGRAGSNGTSGTRLIYDWRVMVNGEHRATFTAKCYARGYHLQDAGGHQIPRGGNLTVQVESQAKFLPTMQSLLAAGRIPTLAEVAAREAEAQRQRDAEAARRLEERREAVVYDVALDLHKLVQAFSNLTGEETPQLQRLIHRAQVLTKEIKEAQDKCVA